LVVTGLVAATARVLSLELFIHHHSYAYISSRRRAFSAALVVIGRRATHLVGCRVMARDLRTLYPSIERIELVPIMYAVEPGQPRRHRDRSEPHGDQPLLLGHLSNLCAEKGLREVFVTLRLLRDSGVAARLLIAGPPVDPRAQRLLDELLAQEPHAQHLGPLYAGARDDFLDEIDLFLFPSRYRHESFGLVVGEALSRGVPVVAYRAGCLTPELVGARGLVVEPDADFPQEVLAWLAGGDVRRWREEPRDLVTAARDEALSVARRMVG
jgi:glycosyltransferase involved in cell wall biosynthesis